MNIAVIYGRESYRGNAELLDCLSALRDAGHKLIQLGVEQELPCGIDTILSVGGDGTFLKAAAKAHGVPVMGINLGRMGFLSENSPAKACKALLNGDFQVEERALLESAVYDPSGDVNPIIRSTALNEVVFHRHGAAMLGINVSLNGVKLPTYWADGLLVSTPSGSTAYSLSAGGPIVLPSSKVLIISPIAPHNLNVRPLVVPLETRINLDFTSRDPEITCSADNDAHVVSAKSRIDVALAQFSLKRLRLSDAEFLQALSDKLHWGEDIRNN